jgi:hypothetical protein
MTTLNRPLAIVDGGIAVFLDLRTHPLVLIGSGLVYAGYRLKTLGTLSQKAWFVMGLFSKTRQLIKQASDEVEAK